MVKIIKGTKIYVGSDHAGFEFKEKIKSYLTKDGYILNDMGPYEYDKDDDYPDFALRVAGNVSTHKDSIGILICGTGAGMAIVANKVKGVRAAEVYDLYSAKMSREHNNANIISLRARDFNFAKIKKIVNAWLKAEFPGEERHERRIRKIIHFENEHLKWKWKIK